MQEKVRGMINDLTRFFNEGDEPFLMAAQVAASEAVEEGLLDTKDTVRMAAQATILHAQVTGTTLREGLCGTQNLCNTNKTIESWTGSKKINKSLGEESRIPIKCSNTSCPCHRDHLFQVGSKEVEVGSYNPLRFPES